MKKILIALTALLTLFGLSSCGEYSSRYNAVGFIHSNERESAYMLFYEFDGRIVYKLKCDEDGTVLRYTAKLENGNILVSYDSGDGKTELLSLTGGDDFEDVSGALPKGTVYVIVETDGKCVGGELRFETARAAGAQGGGAG